MPLGLMALLALGGLGLANWWRHRQQGGQGGGAFSNWWSGWGGRWGQGQGTPPAVPGQNQGGQVIPLPLPVPSGEDVRNSLWFTGQMADELQQGTSDIVKGTLSETERLASEQAARRGYSGGMGSRVVAEAMLGQSPQIFQAAQNLRLGDLNAVLQELSTQAGLFGSIGGATALPMAEFLRQLSQGEAALLGMYNPVFGYGVNPITQADVTRAERRARISQLVNQLSQLFILLQMFGVI